jgi:hypothetical protein
MTATLGDLLTLAGQEISAAASGPGDLPPAALAGIVAEMDRLLAVMNRYAQDCLRCYDDLLPSDRRSPVDLAAAGAAQMLARAAASMNVAADVAPRARRRHPAVTHLRAATGCLVAGRDLLSTHHYPARPGGDAGSPWAGLIGSRPVSAAFMGELAGYAGQLAVLASRLVTAADTHRATALPPAARSALSSAAEWLIFARLTMTGADATGPGPGAGRLLLHNVPANFPPPRHHPITSGHVAELSAGVIATAARLNHLAPRQDGAAIWPSPAASFSWRHNALATAITTHNCEFLLSALADRAAQHRLSRACRTRLRESAQATGQARAAWQALTHAWDPLTTGTVSALSPIASELNDLVVWIGRLARDNPAWTPSRADASPPRDPATLAPAPADIPALASVIRHALTAVTHVARLDMHTAAAAAAKDGLYTRASQLPEYDNLTYLYQYVPAAPAQVRHLLAAYRTAIAASDRTANALTSLLASLPAPTPEHALAQAAASPATAGRLLTQQQRQPAGPAPAAPLAAAGELERFMRGQAITDNDLLLRAMALDRASDLLRQEAVTRIQARATAASEAKHGQGRNPTALPRNRKALAARQDQPATPYRPDPAVTAARPATTRAPKTPTPGPRRQQ